MIEYRRIVLKLSGETLAPEKDSGKTGCYDEARVLAAADAIVRLQKLGVETGVVLGGGNIWRGRLSEAMDPVNADQMGMLATILNALCLQDALRRLGARCTVFTAQEMNRFARLYNAFDARRCMEEGEIVILAGGTGNPFFTTDTGAALRAAELKADAVFKGTTVEGVFDSDPKKNPNAKLIKDISYDEAITRRLSVMDMTAFELCRQRGVKAVHVFSMNDLENILRVARGEAVGTYAHA